MPSPTPDGELVVEERFAIVPEWLLDSNVSDCAVRLYAVLLRFGQSSGARMPSRATLAARLHKRSVDTVDRAMRELVELGAVCVQARYAGRERLTNSYRVRTSRPADPSGVDVDRPVPFIVTPGGGRTVAATPTREAGSPGAARRSRATTGGRTDAAPVAAAVRHNPESLTQSETTPPAIAADCGIADWTGFVARVVATRRGTGQPLGRWTSQCLDASLQLAVRSRSWPAADAAGALLAVAADPATRSPMRVAEAGPWWDGRSTQPRDTALEEEVLAAEQRLADIGGLRVTLQRRARAELASEGAAVTRASVALRSVALLNQQSVPVGAS